LIPLSCSVQAAPFKKENKEHLFLCVVCVCVWLPDPAIPPPITATLSRLLVGSAKEEGVVFSQEKKREKKKNKKKKEEHYSQRPFFARHVLS
jgi:hypothetical protein